MSWAILYRTLPLVVFALNFSAAQAQTSDAIACSTEYVKEGCGTYKFADGSTYVGGFHGGYFDGHGVVTFANGARLEMDFVNGSGRSSEATYIEADGTKISGAFHDVSRDMDHPNPPPTYPFWRGLFKDHAVVIVSVIVSEDGSVSAVQLYKKIDSESYTNAAVEGVKKWHYLPATIAGHPIQMPCFVEIDFSQLG